MKPLTAVQQFEAFARSLDPPVVILPATEKSERWPSWVVFALITLAYVFCEFVYNRSLLILASGTPSVQAMDTIEWIGRTMAGFGCAIVVWRLRTERRPTSEANFSWKSFTVCVALCIPCMWIVQEAVIRAIVGNAAPTTLKAATVAMAGRQALLSPATNLGSAKIDLNDEEKKEQSFAQKQCRQSMTWTKAKDTMNNSRTFWALLGVMSINDASTQTNLKNAALEATRCTVASTPIETKKAHLKYLKETASFSELKSQYENASEQIIGYEKSRWASKSRTESMWRSNVNKVFGFDTTIPWGLTPASFDRHPDVARLVGNASGLGFRVELGLDLEGFRKALAEGAMESLNAPDHEFRTNKTRQRSGEEAYKAVLVPLIGLSLSLFFGMYNAIMLCMTTCAYLLKKSIKTWPSVLVLATIALLPMVVTQPFTNTADYKTMMKATWNAQPVLAGFVAWTARAESISE